MQSKSFSGSYLPSDVTFLLDIINKETLANTQKSAQDLAKKETLIQSGQAHYSDMLTLEQAPSATHQALYQQALEQGKERFAKEMLTLAKALTEIFSPFNLTENKPLVIVSLVRAGVPMGVLLQRLLALPDFSLPIHLPSVHYGVSIIRDRGLDSVALAQIFAKHPESPIIFVDGWTGKGAIYGELQASLKLFSEQTSPHFTQIFHQSKTHELTIPLVTLADPAGVAWLCASEEDWLIPSGLLNSTVSGLISRSLFREHRFSENSFSENSLHRCVYYDELESVDESLNLINTVMAEALGLLKDNHFSPNPAMIKAKPNYRTQDLIQKLAQIYHISNLNRIKPTIAEATRAVLRRDPDSVLLQTDTHPDTVLLRHLCEQKNIKIEVVGESIAPYQAVTLIKKKD